MLTACRILATVLLGLLLAAVIVWGASLFVTCPAPHAESQAGPSTLEQPDANRDGGILHEIACAEILSVTKVRRFVARDPAGAAIWMAAIATVFIAALTATASATRRRAGSKSADRPQIIVRSFKPAVRPAGDDRMAVAFRYVNTGRKRAYISAIATKMLNRRYPLEPGITFETQLFKDFALETGEERQLVVISESRCVGEAARQGPKLREDHRVFCVGHIAYADENGRACRTGFCRWYEPRTRQWLRDPDSEYEYAD